MRSYRTRRVLLASAAVLVALAFGCQSDEEKFAGHLAKAEAYAEKEAWDEAVIEYRNALQLDPNHADAHYGLAKAYFQTGKISEGFWELRETVRLDPSNHDAALEFAQISIYGGEYDEALKQAEAVIADDAENVSAYLVKGQAHEAMKEPDKALAAYEKAVEIDPESRAALQMLANYHRRSGNRELAEPLFRKAAEVEPVAQAYLALASFLVEDRQRDAEAEAVYRRALEVSEPDEQVRAYSLLGNFLYSRDRFDDAVAVLEEGIAKVDDSLDLIYLLARMYKLEGNTEKADELAERATEAHPDELRPYLVLSSYRGRQGDLEGALAAADKAVALAPDSHPARLRRAEVLLELGFRDGKKDLIHEGRTVVEQVLVEEPSHAGALFVKAKIDLAENRIEEATQELRSAIDMRPDWAEAHFLLGTALSVTGERTAARTELARALEIDASLIEARRVLAEVHSALGEYEYALEEGRRYLKEKPHNTAARIQVAQSLVNLGRIDEALQEVMKIPDEDRDASVYFALGRIHLAQGDNEKARELLLKAYEDLPGNADVLHNLLDAEHRLGLDEESSDRIEEALATNPDDAALQRLAGTVALTQGRSDAAEAAFRRAIELDPKDVSSYRQLARLYTRTGRTQQTIETYETALEAVPDQAEIHHFLGVLYQVGGEVDKAVKHYEDAVRYDPDLVEAKNNLAYLYAEKGENLDRALDLAQDAKSRLPNDPNAADTLGWVLYRRGVPSAAIGYLKEAESATGADDPNLGLIRLHLAQAYEASGDVDAARKTLDQAFAAYESYVEARESRGAPKGEDPTWIADARKMRERL